MLKLQRKLKNKKFIKILSVWVVIVFFSILFAPFLSVANADSKEERARKIEEALNAQATSTQDRTPVQEPTPEPPQDGAPSWTGGDGETDDGDNGGGETGAGAGGNIGAPVPNDSPVVTVSESPNKKKIEVNVDGSDGGKKERLTDEERDALKKFRAWDKTSVPKIRGQLAAECYQDDNIRNSDSDALMEACIQEKLEYYRDLKERELLDEDDDVLRNIRSAELQLKFDGQVSEDLVFTSKEGQQAINDMCAESKNYYKCLEDLKKKRFDDLADFEEAMKDHSLLGDLLKAKDGAGGWFGLITDHVSDHSDIYALAAAGGLAACWKNKAECLKLLKGADYSKVRGFGVRGVEEFGKNTASFLNKFIPKGLSFDEAHKTAKIAAGRLYDKGYTGLNIANGKNFLTHESEMMSLLSSNEKELMPLIGTYMGAIDDAVLGGLDLYADASMLYKAGSLLYGGAAAIGSIFGLAGAAGVAVGGGLLTLGVAGAGYAAYDICNSIYLSYEYPNQFKRDYLDGGISTSDDLETAMEEAVDKYEDTGCFDYSPPSEIEDSSASSSNSTRNIQADVYRQTGIDIYNDVAD